MMILLLFLLLPTSVKKMFFTLGYHIAMLVTNTMSGWLKCNPTTHFYRRLDMAYTQRNIFLKLTCFCLHAFHSCPHPSLEYRISCSRSRYYRLSRSSANIVKNKSFREALEVAYSDPNVSFMAICPLTVGVKGVDWMTPFKKDFW